MSPTRPHRWVACSLAAACTVVPAQEPASAPLPTLPRFLSDLLGKPAPPVSTTAAATQKVTLEPNAAALNELRVDKQCLKVEERYDVWAKAGEYAGTNAQLRLQALVASDFRHDQLTESDKRMLRYLAYTTVWIPAPLEAAMGKLYTKLGQGGGDTQAGGSGRTQRKALERLSGRLDEQRQAINGFPGGATLVLDPDLRDGAFARAGGLVVVSPRFLGLMDDKDAVRDVVFAHELSHLYKRHTVKELQYQLLTTANGFALAKRLLARTNPSSGFSLPDFVVYAQWGHDLLEFTRSAQLRYSKDQELEADACSLNWLAALQVDSRQAWRVFGDLLNDQSADQQESYQGFHPSPPERLANVQKALGRAPTPPGRPASRAK